MSTHRTVAPPASLLLCCANAHARTGQEPVGGGQRCGSQAAINEDAFFREDNMGFYVVADGVGGHNKGEIASRECIDQLHMWVRGARRDLDRLIARIEEGDLEANWEIRRLLESGLQSACYMVFGMAELSPDKRGMSTTCSAMLARGGFAFAAHVGDSRLYRIPNRAVLQITEDHPWHNSRNSVDVDGNGRVEPFDVLLVTNYLNANPSALRLPPPPTVLVKLAQRLLNMSSVN